MFANDVSISIQRADVLHAEQVAHLHYEHIFPARPGWDIGDLALKFLSAYYRELSVRSDCALYVALQDGQAAGYCSLVTNQRKVMFAMVMKNTDVLLYALRWRYARLLFSYVSHKLFHETLGGKWQGARQFRGNVEVRSVAVDPRYRGRRIGARLLAVAKDGARSQGWTPLLAWVAESNVESCAMFERAGFVRAGMKVEDGHVVCLYQVHVGESE